MSVRFVLAPDGTVTPDFSGKLPGRGAWVTARRDALEAAIKRQAFSRSFKAPTTTPASLIDLVEAGLAKGALSALGLARRTGDAVTGFEKARAALKDGKASVWISARDGAADGKRKMSGAAKDAAQIMLFDEHELSAALGRDHVIHAAIMKGAAAKRFLQAARRLEGFRSSKGADE